MQRNTRQRTAILAAFQKIDRALAPEEILAIELHGHARRYEAAGDCHHHHFRCRDYDRLFPMDGRPGDLRDLAPRGFLVEAHDILLTGLCSGCREGRR